MNIEIHRRLINKKPINTIFLSITVFILSLYVLPASSSTGTFYEDFTTLIHRDDLNSTVSGWGTGTIRSSKLLPGLTGIFNTSGYAYGACINENYAYIADGPGGMKVFDVSDPANPLRVGNISFSSYAMDVVINGDLAFVAAGFSGLQIIYIRNPASPVYLGSYNTDSFTHDLVVNNNITYLAAGHSGLQVIDTTNPADPVLIGSYNTTGEAKGIEVTGTYAYVADRGNGLLIFDISNLSNPTLTSSYDTPSEALDVCVKGNYAFIACYESGLQIVNISNPLFLTYAGSYDTTGHTLAVFVDNDSAYIATHMDGLRVFDISNPTVPLQTGFFESFLANGVFVADGYIYLTCFIDGFQILEVDRITGRQYASPCFAQSRTIFSCIKPVSLVRATLTCFDALPEGTYITYYLSADNGSNWNQVTANVSHSFSSPGQNLKWKAILTSNDTTRTPEINSIIINYMYVSINTTLLTVLALGFVVAVTVLSMLFFFSFRKIGGITLDHANCA